MSFDPGAVAVYLRPAKYQPFWSASEADIAERFQTLNKKKSHTAVTNMNGSDIWCSPMYQGEVYWSAKKDTLIYEADMHFLTLEVGKVPLKILYQSLVWRDSDYPETTRMPSEIFWRMFLQSSSKMIASDVEQPLEGKRFWQYRIAEALERSLDVSICYMDKDGNVEQRRVVRSTPIKTLRDLNGVYSNDQTIGSSFILVERR